MWKALVDWFVYSILGLSAKSHLASALNFFIYDTVKTIRLFLHDWFQILICFLKTTLKSSIAKDIGIIALPKPLSGLSFFGAPDRNRN